MEGYLKQNPVFESFSSLARVATLSFIGQKQAVHLNPIQTEEPKKRPSFLWDYDLTQVQVREILNTPGFSDKKLWLVARIITQAKFEEVFNYLNVDLIKRALPKLRLPKKVRERWETTVQIWTGDIRPWYPPDTSHK